jgi:hypothetical protein
MISLQGTGSIDVEMREMYRRYGRIVRTWGNVERVDHEDVASESSASFHLVWDGAYSILGASIEAMRGYTLMIACIRYGVLTS